MQEFFFAFMSSPQFAAVAQAFAVLIVYAVARVVMRFIVRKTILAAKRNSRMSQTAVEGKIKTLSSLFRSAGNVVVFGILVLILLDAIGIDVRPILAGAGIIGFAVGFGMQSLVKDVVAGLFIIMENQFNVGDRVEIGNFQGKVTKISMRSTVLRNDEGNVVYIPNGSITHVVNVKKTPGV